MTDAPPPSGQPEQPYQPPQQGQPQQPYQQPGAYQSAPQQPLSPSDEKLWSTLTHVGALVASFFSLGWAVPLITFLVFKDRGPFVREHTRQALNFQLTLLIAYIAGWILSVIGIGLLIIVAAGILSLIFSIIAAIAANKGEMYRYPIAIQFVK